MSALDRSSVPSMHFKLQCLCNYSYWLTECIIITSKSACLLIYFVIVKWITWDGSMNCIVRKGFFYSLVRLKINTPILSYMANCVIRKFINFPYKLSNGLLSDNINVSNLINPDQQLEIMYVNNFPWDIILVRNFWTCKINSLSIVIRTNISQIFKKVFMQNVYWIGKVSKERTVIINNIKYFPLHNKLSFML